MHRAAPATLLPAAALAASLALAPPRSAAAPDAAAPARLARFGGAPSAPVARLAEWRQLYFELRGDPGRAAWPTLDELSGRARAARAAGAVPLALVDAVADGGRTVAAAALVPHTHRGGAVAFRLDPALVASDAPAALARLEFDADDGLGFRPLALGAPLEARYAAPGPRAPALRLTRADGSVAVARFAFDVRALAAPVPDDTLVVTGATPHLGGVASARAYVRLAPGHSAIVNPVVVPEGFDLDNSLGWDELWALLNQQGLADTLGALGYDAVVLDFDDATDHIERNAHALVALLAELSSTLPPGATAALVGPSMGGLVARYALAWMEAHGQPHRVRAFVSFDAPHRGANIPLGIQYWVQFFADQSADAAFLLSRLQTPAARQMLVYHLTEPPSSSPGADPLRADFLANLDAVGGWPARPRLTACANGSGAAAGQGFPAAAQIIRYEFDNFVVRILGNVWAVPDGGTAKIFDGRIRILFISDTQRAVTVTGTLPYDHAPGGWRATMTQMDTTEAPYGDIVALHPAHAFIPTVSALDVAGVGLFHDVLADPDLLARTPFAAVYAPAENEEHVTVTPANKLWFLGEITRPLVDAPTAPAAPALALSPVAPNPSRGAVALRFRLPAAGRARLAVFDAAGRAVAAPLDAALGAGAHAVAWDGRGAGGRRVPPGVYLARLEAGGAAVARRFVVLD